MYSYMDMLSLRSGGGACHASATAWIHGYRHAHTVLYAVQYSSVSQQLLLLYTIDDIRPLHGYSIRILYYCQLTVG